MRTAANHQTSEARRSHEKMPMLEIASFRVAVKIVLEAGIQTDNVEQCRSIRNPESPATGRTVGIHQPIAINPPTDRIDTDAQLAVSVFSWQAPKVERTATARLKGLLLRVITKFRLDFLNKVALTKGNLDFVQILDCAVGSAIAIIVKNGCNPSCNVLERNRDLRKQVRLEKSLQRTFKIRTDIVAMILRRKWANAEIFERKNHEERNFSSPEKTHAQDISNTHHAANPSRVRFSGASSVQTTSSSMRMPP